MKGNKLRCIDVQDSEEDTFHLIGEQLALERGGDTFHGQSFIIRTLPFSSRTREPERVDKPARLIIRFVRFSICQVRFGTLSEKTVLCEPWVGGGGGSPIPTALFQFFTKNVPLVLKCKIQGVPKWGVYLTFPTHPTDFDSTTVLHP